MIKMRQSLVLAAAIGAAMAIAQTGTAADTFSVRKTDIIDRKAVFATVQSVDQIAARSRIGGTVSDLSVDEGTAVEKDQVIARIIDPKLRLQIAAADARIQSLVAQKNLAVTALKRVQNLRKTGTVSQARLDEAQTNLDVVDQQLAAMRAERKVVAEQRTEGDVLAPVTGRVLSVPVTAGSVVLPGERIAMIATENYVLRMSLPERFARFIKQGDSVYVGARGMAEVTDGAMRTGSIRQVYPEISGGRVTADVEVTGLGDFFVGERMRVYVGAGERSTYIVPEDYVAYRYGVSFVQLKDGCDTVVQPGQTHKTGIEILSGLSEGDTLVIPGSVACAGR